MASLGRMEDVVELLESTGTYRCLRRVPDLEFGPPLEPSPRVRIGVVVRVEATGHGPCFDAPVDVAMVRFAFTEGRILAVLATLEGSACLPMPSRTGLEKRVGAAADLEAIQPFVAGADVLVGHDAACDREFLERAIPGFPLRPWACSLVDVPWEDEGVRDRRLCDLLAGRRLFADGCGAIVECASLLHLLRLPLPRSGRPTFEAMLKRAFEPTAMFFAEGAPEAAASSILAARGYRWLDGRDGGPRCWLGEVPFRDAGAEAMFLYGHVYADRRVGLTWLIVEPLHRFRSIAILAACRVPAPTLKEAGLE